MEFKDVVRGRRSVRSYSDKKVDREILNEILEDATWAPSGVNLQPWHFVVAESDEAKNIIKETMRKNTEIHANHLRERFANNPEVVRSTMGFMATLGNAPVIIMVFQGKEEYPLAEDVVMQSISAAIENLLLSAYDKGLSTCWLAAPIEDNLDCKLKDSFAPDKGKLLSMVCLGYADENAVIKAPKRKDGRIEFV